MKYDPGQPGEGVGGVGGCGWRGCGGRGGAFELEKKMMQRKHVIPEQDSAYNEQAGGLKENTEQR